jgi:anti-sigma-K factor RskA
MESQQFIDSGILELYALQQLNAEQQNEVESMCAQYTDVADELAAIEFAMFKLANAQKIAPPSSLKVKILEEINQNTQNVTNSSTSTIVAIEKPISSNNTPQSNIRIWKTLAVAASLIALISTYSGFTFWQKSKNEATTLANNQLTIDSINKTMLSQKQSLAELNNIVTNEDFEKIMLSNVDTTKKISPASIYWNKTSQAVYLAWIKLQPLPETQQYQLWAIVDGKPIDAGLVNQNGALQKMNSFASAEVFAITIEPKGGSKEPTLTSLIVLGKI